MHHFYEKIRAELQRGLASPFDSTFQKVANVSDSSIINCDLYVQQEDCSFKLGKVTALAPVDSFYELTYELEGEIHSKLLTHSNLIINNLDIEIVAFLYTDDFITAQFSHACPSIIITLLDNMEKYKFNISKTKRTLKAIFDMLLHTLRPFTVDCPHSNMNEAMDEIACHMHNHFFKGDIMVFENRLGEVQAFIIETNTKESKKVVAIDPLTKSQWEISFPIDGQILEYYSSDKFAHRSIPNLIEAFKADAGSKFKNYDQIQTFLKSPQVSEFYSTIGEQF